IHRILCATGSQEVQIALTILICTAQHFLRQSCRSSKGGRILVHVKIVVEMRNIRPFGFHVIVNDAYILVMSVIFLCNIQVDAIKVFSGQRLTIAYLLMDNGLKLCELSLTEQSPLSAFQVITQNCQTYFVVFDLL